MSVILFNDKSFDLGHAKVFDLNPYVGKNDPAVNTCEDNGSDWLNAIVDIDKPRILLHQVNLQNDAQSLLKESLKEVDQWVLFEFFIRWENFHHNPSQNFVFNKFLGQKVES